MILSSLLPGIAYIFLKYLFNLIFIKFGIDSSLNVATAIFFPVIIYFYTKNKKYTVTSIFFAAVCILIKKNSLPFVLLVGPISEEIVFREFCFKNNDKTLMVLSSLLFAIGHTGLINIFLAFVFGIVLCQIKNTRGLKSCVLLHSTVNFIVLILNFLLI